MDRRLLNWAFLLLFIEVLLLLFETGFLETSMFGFSQKQVGESIGYFSVTKKNVKRKSRNSLVWSGSQNDDEIYYFDSILTLEQSSAHLILKDDTRLSVSENTLVVVEPPKVDGSDRLRLVFQKGHLRATTGETDIESNSWVIETTQKSDVRLTTLSDEKVEVEVTSGEIVLSHEGKKSTQVEKGTVVSLAPNEILNVEKLENNVQIDGAEELRIYSHSWPIKYSTSWSGEASSLRIVNSSGGESSVSVKNRNQYEGEYRQGTYLFKLKGEGGVSRTVARNFWDAPIIHLISPLPRDRVQSEKETLFIWNQVDGVENYRLVIQDMNDNVILKKESSRSSLRASLPEGEYKWKVIGIDSTGAEIPALYDYRIYSVVSPLEAPRIYDPQIRAPAKSGSFEGKPNFFKWVFELFVSAAEAGDEYTYEALFEWESVAGAQSYTIEISKDALFRDPLVLASVNGNRFVWSKFVEGRYYWRVAAGGEMGPLGYYTRPTPLILRFEEYQQKDSQYQKVTVRKTKLKEKKENKTLSTNKDIQNLKEKRNEGEKLKRKSSQDTVNRKFYNRFGFGYFASGWSLTASEDVKTTGSLVGLFEIESEFYFNLGDGKIYAIAEAQVGDAKPVDEDQLPFQTEISVWSGVVSLNYTTPYTYFYYGLNTRFGFEFEREDNEIIDVKRGVRVGPNLGYIIEDTELLFSDVRLSAVFGDSVTELGLDFRVEYIVFNEPDLNWSMGLSGQVIYQMLDGGHGGYIYSIGPGARLGW